MDKTAWEGSGSCCFLFLTPQQAERDPVRHHQHPHTTSILTAPRRCHRPLGGLCHLPQPCAPAQRRGILHGMWISREKKNDCIGTTTTTTTTAKGLKNRSASIPRQLESDVQRTICLLGLNPGTHHFVSLRISSNFFHLSVFSPKSFRTFLRYISPSGIPLDTQ